MSDTETAYLLNRAEEEAVAAIQADHPAASAAHRQLSMLYSAKALIELGGMDKTPLDARPSRKALFGG